MSDIPPRHELKYLVSDEDARRISRSLRPFCELDLHSQASPDAQYLVQSLYLDSPRHHLYWASKVEQVGRLKSAGLTILLAEQNVEFCLDLADRVYVLEKGHIRYEGTARAFREDESIRHQFLAL